MQLHGDLESLRCTLCHQASAWSEEDERKFLAGKASRCQSCKDKDEIRQACGKRGIKVGTLRPNIVLYGETHPAAEELASITTHDLKLSPDILLILGTSLRVHGLKTIIREFARSLHARPAGKGKVIFVNLSAPSESIWKDFMDYWVCMDCDDWVKSMKRHRPDLFQLQRALAMPLKKTVGEKKQATRKRPIDRLEDKENIHPITNNSSPVKPQVVIAETPQKKRAWTSHTSACKTIQKMPQASEPSMELGDCPELLTLSQLATPPPSGRLRGSKDTGAKIRRTLTDAYNNFDTSPSKRRRRDIAIYEDRYSEAGA